MTDKVILNKLILKDIGDAIRDKEGSNELIPTLEMASRIRNINDDEGYGIYTAQEDRLLDGTSISYSNDRIIKLRASAFGHCTDFLSINCPNVIEIGVDAFKYCSSLNNVNFPKLEKIDTSAFYACPNLIDIDFPLLKNVGPSSFAYCTKLENINLPNAKGIGQNAFERCLNLKNINLPNATSLQYGAFSSCGKLININLPSVRLMGEYTLFGCNSLKKININFIGKSLSNDNRPDNNSYLGYLFGASSYTDNDSRVPTSLKEITLINQSKINEFTFHHCFHIESVDLLNVKEIKGYSFTNCYSLTKLVIRSNTQVCLLSSSGAFENCYHFNGTTDSTYNPEGLKDGRIYVSNNLIEDYKENTNWSLFADIIKPMDLENGENISRIFMDSTYLSLIHPRNATIYLDNFINVPNVEINIDDGNLAEAKNLNVTTEKITFEIIALGEGTTTVTVNINGDYSKVMTVEVNYFGNMEYRVEEVEGEPFGFVLNNDGYFESNNDGVDDSYAICKLNFTITDKNNVLLLKCISDSEVDCDFSILSNIDTPLELSNSIDTINVYKSFKSNSNNTPITIAYPETTVGEHYIYIKYLKDGSESEGKDTFQFKVLS